LTGEVTLVEPCSIGISELADFIVPAIDNASLEKVEILEDELIANGFNEIDLLNSEGLRDKLVGGLYARVLNIPKGMFLTGKVHKRPYIDIFIKGDVTVKSHLADGTVEATERVNSFRFFEGVPGRKRVLFAHEDTTWVTVDPTDAARIEDVEGDVVFSKMGSYMKALKETA
jgi:hypothetical protein